MRDAFATLETDIMSEDPKLQGNAVWISGQMLKLFSEFFVHVNNLGKVKDEIQEQIQDVAEGISEGEVVE